MAVYPVIVTTTAVSISTASSNLTYDQLLSTLNNTCYKLQKLYIQAQSNNQVSTQFFYKKVGVFGTQKSFNTSGDIDPYQYQPTLFLDVEGNELVFDNLSVISFTLLPNQTIELYFITDAVSTEDWLLENQQKDKNSDAKDSVIPVSDKNAQIRKRFLNLLMLTLIIFVTIKIIQREKRG